MKDKQNVSETVARAFAGLDADILIDILDPNCVYESQSVFEPLTGKSRIADYLRRKFATIRRGNPRKRLKASPADGLTPQDAVVVIHQDRRQLYLLFEFTWDGLISRMDLCAVPPFWLRWLNALEPA